MTASSVQRLPEPRLLNRWGTDPGWDGFMLEGATVMNHGPHRPCHAPASRAAALALRPQVSVTEPQGWRQIWHSHLHPHQQVLLCDSMNIEGSVTRVEVRDAVHPRDAVLRPLMVAKRHTIGPASTDALRVLLNQDKPLAPLLGSHRAIPPELRDAYYGRLARSPSCARRILLSPNSVLTLHPMATGDLQHLLRPISQLDAGRCEETTLHVAAHLVTQLHMMAQARMCHGDIKPENILFWADGTFAFTDFGSAFGLWEKDLLRKTPKTGTLSYSACDFLFCDGLSLDGDSSEDEDDSLPLQGMSRGTAVPEPLFFAADVYALGVTLLHASTDLQPFEVDETDSSVEPLARRRELWHGIYGDIEAFSRGPASSAQPGPFLAPSPPEEHDRAATMARAFGLLRQRSPALLPIVVAMLHPDPARRPDALTLLGALADRAPQGATSAHSVAPWLTSLIARDLDPGWCRMSWRLPELAAVRPRRHTVGTPKLEDEVRQTIRDDEADSGDFNGGFARLRDSLVRSQVEQARRSGASGRPSRRGASRGSSPISIVSMASHFSLASSFTSDA